jgi:hypothetical protein
MSGLIFNFCFFRLAVDVLLRASCRQVALGGSRGPGARPGPERVTFGALVDFRQRGGCGEARPPA